VGMDEQTPGGAVASDELRCYRHPDRETLLSCSNCERPICTSCAQPAAVGLRCPECSGTPTGIKAVGKRMAPGATGAFSATAILVAINVLIFVVEMSQGIGVRGGLGGSSIIVDGGVAGPPVADGEWWRLLTAGFIHAGIGHIAFNMLALWWLGGALEQYIGTGRMLGIYFAAILWGSAGAIILSPNALTVGASGGVFGLMAALLVIQRQRGISLLGSSLGMVLLLNLGITFFLPGISIGGHLGGLAGGAAAAFAISGFGKGHIAYGKLKGPAITGLVGVMAAAVVVSVIIA
jgi:membrane associated rhomboid family serine protease